MTIAAGTVAYYPLIADGSDSSGNGYNLTLNGGTVPFVTISGMQCAGKYTSDANTFVAPAGLRTALQNATAITLEFWFYTTGTTLWVMAGNPNGGEWGVQLGANGVFQFRENAVAQFLQTPASAYTINNWYYVAVVSTSTSDAIWIGQQGSPVVQVASAAHNGLWTGAATVFYVGRHPVANNTFSGGYLAGVRFSNVARTSFPTVDSVAVNNFDLMRRRRR